MERRRVKQAVHILTHPDLIKQPPSFNEHSCLLAQLAP
jgi:hypothetical protein